MKMKMKSLLAFSLTFIVFGITAALAQSSPEKETEEKAPVVKKKIIEKKKEVRVKKHTILDRYEPEMVVPADERLEMKKRVLAAIKRKRGIIDTMSISDRKKRKLLQELYRNPMSKELSKAIADTEFEDEEF